jgi:hypothetical protein
MSGIFNWLWKDGSCLRRRSWICRSLLLTPRQSIIGNPTVWPVRYYLPGEKEDGELANKAVFTRYQEWCRDKDTARKISSISRRPCPCTAALKEETEGGGNKKTLVFGYDSP